MVVLFNNEFCDKELTLMEFNNGVYIDDLGVLELAMLDAEGSTSSSTSMYIICSKRESESILVSAFNVGKVSLIGSGYKCFQFNDSVSDAEEVEYLKAAGAMITKDTSTRGILKALSNIK